MKPVFRRSGRALFAGLMLLGFTGCATYGYGPAVAGYTSLDEVNRAVGDHQPVEYRVGYMEGCDSGHVSAGKAGFTFKKDQARFEKDALYQRGWEDGYVRCKDRYVRATTYAVPTYVYPSFSFGYGRGYWPRYRYGFRYGPRWGGFYGYRRWHRHHHH